MLEVTGLTCAYGDIRAVEDLSFEIEPGEIFGLIGANGAGKTTTLLALAGLVVPRAGTVSLEGRDITHVPAQARQGVALVPEGRRIFADLSVEENLTVGGTRSGAQALAKNRDEVFEIFPRLKDRRRQLAGSLSGGEQQMLAIGRAVMAEPKLLLVDELSLGLMPLVIDECYRVLQRLRDRGLAILLVEQSTERVLQSADRIAVLESGRLAWSGSGAEAASNSAIVEAYLGLGEG